MRRRLRKGGDSINSFMAWVGGKKALRDEILARFPRNYKRYIEVFGGAGWVLFHKPPGNDFEVFNDFNGNLVNLYRCVREQPEALRNELRYCALPPFSASAPQRLSQPENSRMSISWRIPVREMPTLTTAELGDMTISGI